MAQVFGRYLLLRQLGRGGMAEVFLARLGRGPVAKLLALKRLLPAYSRNQRLVRRLAAEARLTVWLTHPNIVQVFDFGRVENSYFIAMEFVDGCDLRSLIQPPGQPPIQLPLEVCLNLGYGLLDALRYAHNCTDAGGKPLGIIHRDVSPHNVLISRDGHPKLADFGVARAVASDRETQPGAVLGKYSYMPPEQARGEAYDARVDVYAAGATLYQMLTGSKPFPDRTLAEALADQLPPPPSSLRPSISPALDRLVLRALAPRSADRFPSASSMADAVLEQLQAVGGPPKPHQLGRLVEQQLRARSPARDQARPVGLRERATRSDIVAAEDSLIGEEVTRVQNFFAPPALEPQQTEEDAILPAAAPGDEDSLPPTRLRSAEDGLPDREPDTIPPGPPPRLPSLDRLLPPTSSWSQPPVTKTSAVAPPPVARARPAGLLSTGFRVWVIAGLGAAAGLVIFGLGLLVGRGSVEPNHCPPQLAVAAGHPPPSRPMARSLDAAPPAAVAARPPDSTPTPDTMRHAEVARRSRVRRRRRGRPHPTLPAKAAPAKQAPARPGPATEALTATQRQQARRLVKAAQSAYVAGAYRQAMHRARNALRLLPGDMAALQVYGSCACYLERLREARWTLARLPPKGAGLLRRICARNGLKL